MAILPACDAAWRFFVFFSRFSFMSVIQMICRNVGIRSAHRNHRRTQNRRRPTANVWGERRRNHEIRNKKHKLKQILYCQMKVLLELPRFKCGTLLLPLCAFFILEKKKNNNNNSLWCVHWRGPDLLWTRELSTHTDVFFFFLSSPSLITYCLKPRQSFAAVTLLPQAIDRIKSFTLNGFGKWKLKNLLKRFLFSFFFFIYQMEISIDVRVMIFVGLVCYTKEYSSR